MTERYHDCPHGLTFDTCEVCIEEKDQANTIVPGGDESDPDSTMDTLVQQASIPSLASLFKKGKEAGLIKPGVEYGNKGA